MAINAQNRSLPDWFARIRTRQLVLPRFQRFEAWGHKNITQMFNTILQGLPIGAVLVLEIGNEQPFISRAMKGAPTDGERITEHLLDGQQRLTGLWRGLNNNYEDRTYFLYLAEDEETGMPYYVDSIARWQNDGDIETRPFWANKPNEQWKRRMIPLDLCKPESPGEDQPRLFRQWANEAIHDRDERDEISDKMSSIRSLFASFNIPYLSLPVLTKKETALDVFIKMNTSATPLTIYDIVVAQVEAGMGESLHELVAKIRSICPNIAEYYSPDVLSLYASALIQGKEPTRVTYMNKDFGRKLLDNWDRYVNGVKRATTFLEDERIFDEKRLPTDVIVPVLVALWACIPEGGDVEGRARLILRRYIWRAFFSNRYEKSTNNRASTDYNQLKLLIMNGSEHSNPTIFDDKEYPLPCAQELVSAGWPTKKDRLARAILALALRQGGLDLADGSTCSRMNLNKREYHHLFPVAYLNQLDIPVSDEKIYCALNCALVTWYTNRTISQKKPERYLADRFDDIMVDKKQVTARLSSHLIPYEEMINGDYDEFLNRRAEMIANAMTEICNGVTS